MLQWFTGFVDKAPGKWCEGTSCWLVGSPSITLCDDSDPRISAAPQDCVVVDSAAELGFT